MWIELDFLKTEGKAHVGREWGCVSKETLRHSRSLACVFHPIFKYFTISDTIRRTEWQESAFWKHQIAAQSIHLPGATWNSLIISTFLSATRERSGSRLWTSLTNILTAFRSFLTESFGCSISLIILGLLHVSLCKVPRYITTYLSEKQILRTTRFNLCRV